MRAGYRIGNCEIVGELARGGQGVVYEARDLTTGQPRAIKVLLENDAEMRARFRHEARALANLRHPGLPRVFDLQERDGAFCMVQELIDGHDLRSWVEDRGPCTPEQAVRIVRSLAETLDYVHNQGLVHRDLKPGNVVVERGTGRVVLLDFGMLRARLQQAWATQDQASLTVEGQIMGTPAYMAPEQVEASLGTIDRRTDVYALGGTLFTLLTGRPPFVGQVMELFSRLLTESPPDPRRLAPGTPAHLAELCLRCLAKTQRGRPQTARDVALLLDEPVEDLPVTRSAPHWALLSLPGVVVGLAVGLWIVFDSPDPQAATAPPPPPPAMQPDSPRPPEQPPAEQPVEQPAEQPPKALADLSGEALYSAALSGDPEAMWRYGEERLYADDGGATEALTWFEKAAEAGVVPAMNQASRLHDQSLGVPANHERGAYWAKRSAERDDPVGLAGYGFALIFGRGVPRDVARGEQILARAGDHPEALYKRGLEYEWRYRDHASAMKLYKRAGEAGHGDAWSRIAHLLSTELPPEDDLPLAFSYYEKGTALGSCHSIHGLARLLVTDVPGRAQDPARSRELFERSARLGIADSSLVLARLDHDRGDYEGAHRYAQNALRLGQGAGAALLAELYMNGQGVPRDPGRVWPLWIHGASLQDPTSAYAMSARIRQGVLPSTDLMPQVREVLRRFRLERYPSLREVVTAALSTLENQLR